MHYSDISKPGIGDPFWYEWSVGLKYIINMLLPENNIKYVELQADVEFGLDDVVITYNDESKLFIQVKHTRVDDTLTFGDLVSIGGSDNKQKVSVLKELAQSWNLEKDKYTNTRVCLYTNRKEGSRMATVRKNGVYKRPPLKRFWSDLKQQINQEKEFEEISFPGYEEAWEELKEQLSDIPSNGDKLSFLRCLDIDTGESGLQALEKELIDTIRVVFGTNERNADIILTKLDHALRKWTTSNRETSCISAENVLDVLSGGIKTEPFNHDLIPNEPFFRSREGLIETIEGKLKNNKEKVLFLSGIPGTGKTNIISKLSAKRNSLIDIRYYAYEPIDPSKEYHPMDVSRRVEKEYFWNELFCQLRKLLRGQLQKYSVPIMNDLLTLEQLKTRFFEIASAYARDRGDYFIIAIDGIDHAARALHIDETFLPSLPNPEYLPENIKILLAGQPKEGYKNYPTWLFTDKENIEQIDVPNLQSEDIRDLVNIHFSEILPSDTREQMAHIINKYANGNTLSAIFAIYEAKQHQDIIELEQQLKNRKLSGNIEEYYYVIWKNAISKIEMPFIDYKMAGILAFFNESINENKLSKIFTKESISASVWRNVLKALKPLLIEQDGSYTILHNDVRVFLSGIIATDNDQVKEIYGYLADYYLCLSKKENSYYRNIYRFLKSADRIEEFKSLFIPDYIINAFADGIELDELKDTAQDLLEDIISKDPIDWATMRNLSFSYLTINQIEKSNYEIEEIQFRKKETYIDIHPYECYVEGEASWDPDLILDVLTLCERLFNNGYRKRAIQLFHRWFSGISILQLYDTIESTKEDKDYSPYTKRIAILYGKCVVLSKSYSFLNGCKDIASTHASFVFFLQDSILKNIIKENTSEKLSETLKEINIIYPDSLLFCIKYFLDNNRITDMAIVEKQFHDSLMKNASGILFSVFMQIVSSLPMWSTKEREDIESTIVSMQLPDSLQEENILYCSIYGFVFSYLHPSKTYKESARLVLRKFMEKHKGFSQEYFSLFFSAICLIGTWFSCVQRNVEIHFRPSDMKYLMESLFISIKNPGDGFVYTKTLYSNIMKAYIYLAKKSEARIKKVVDDICSRLFTNYPVNTLLNAGFYYYQDNIEILQAWITYWLGETGKCWKESIGNRNRIIYDLLDAKHLYDVENCIDMSFALDNAKWSVIGYSSHKEYSCDYLLKWYNEIVDQNEQYVNTYARRIKEISDKIGLVGDNRIEYILNSKIYADLVGMGFQKAVEIMHDSHYLSQCLEEPSYLVDGLIGLLKRNNYNKDKLLEIWSFGMALLDWKDDSNHATILALQRAIEICAKKSGIENIYDVLKEYGPAYVDKTNDPIRFIVPKRWCDCKVESPKNDLAINIIDEYLSQSRKMNSDDLIRVIEELKQKNEIDNEKLSLLYSFELSSSESGIEHNSLIEYLTKTLPNNYIDKTVREYLHRKIKTDEFFLESDISAFALWQIRKQDDTYNRDGMERLIQAHMSWLTAVGHYQEPEFTDENDYNSFINWSNVISIESLYYQLILIILRSNDADAVRTALAGLFGLMRTNSEYIMFIERDWPIFHYRAKEWLCMIYELLWHYTPCQREHIENSIRRHCSDVDFNVSLYAKILLGLISNKDEHDYRIVKHDYFDQVPVTGKQKLIQTNNKRPWMIGNDYVHRALELFGDDDYTDIELRAVAYSHDLKYDEMLIPIKRRRIGGYHQVVLSKIVYSFFRVLYKDWYNGRWTGMEVDLGRIILSASEPYNVLISPNPWNSSSGYIIENIEKFVKKSKDDQRKHVEELLHFGVNEKETIIAGSIHEYTHNQEVFGFSLCYLDSLWMNAEDAKYVYEINSRMLFQNRDDFTENAHYNITLHHNGVESFKLSGITCGFSKTALNAFNWRIRLSKNGFALFNNDELQIGKFECYFGRRNDLNRNINNTPILQRWIISKEAVAVASRMINDRFQIKMTSEVVIQNDW